MESLAEKFCRITQKHYLTNITHRNNISSILLNGLLCYDKTKEMNLVFCSSEPYDVLFKRSFG